MTTFIARAGHGSLQERALLRAAQNRDPRACEQLLQRFRPLLDATVRHFRVTSGIDRDDLVQEARIAFLQAIERWCPDRGPFAAFAQTCVHNAVINAIDRAGAKKHQILNRACELQTGRDDEDERCAAGVDSDPEAVAFAREQLTHVLGALKLLSAWERAALTAVLNDSPHREIALEHGVSAHAVKLAVHRGRRKLARQITENELVERADDRCIRRNRYRLRAASGPAVPPLLASGLGGPHLKEER